MPDPLKYFDNAYRIDEKFSQIKTKDYEKFFTKKTSKYLPELVLFFGEEEICFYGYPFLLLETCEIL